MASDDSQSSGESSEASLSDPGSGVGAATQLARMAAQVMCEAS